MFDFRNRNKKSGGQAVRSPQADERERAIQAQVREQTLQKLGEARRNGNKIYNELSGIKFNLIAQQSNIQNVAIERELEEGEKVTLSGVEILNNIEDMVNTVKAMLEREDPTTYLVDDTEKIDGELHYFAQMLNQSLKEGDVRTAEVCCFALIYGVYEGHKPIPTTIPIEVRNQELKERVQKIDIYSTLVTTAREIYKLTKSREKLRKQYKDDVLPKYLEARKNLEEDSEAKPHIYEEINGVDPALLAGAHLEAWKITTEHDTLLTMGEQLKTAVAGIDVNISQYENQIRLLRTAMNMSEIRNNAKLDQKIDQLLQTVPKQMSILTNSAMNHQKIIDNMFDSFDEVLKNPELMTSIATAAVRHRDLIAKQKAEEERYIAALNRKTKEMEDETDGIERRIAAEQAHQKAKMDKIAKEFEEEEIKTKPIIEKAPVVKSKEKKVKRM